MSHLPGILDSSISGFLQDLCLSSLLGSVPGATVLWFPRAGADQGRGPASSIQTGRNSDPDNLLPFLIFFIRTAFYEVILLLLYLLTSYFLLVLSAVYSNKNYFNCLFRLNCNTLPPSLIRFTLAGCPGSGGGDQASDRSPHPVGEHL